MAKFLIDVNLPYYFKLWKMSSYGKGMIDAA